MFVSCCFRSIFSICCKWSLNYNKELTAFQQIAYFNCSYFVITLISLFFTDVNVFSIKFIKKQKISLMVLRNILAIASIVFLAYALKFMHISDVFSVFFIYPAFVIMFSVCFLGEKSWWFDYVCCVASFTGAVLIVKPDFLFHNNNSESNYFFLV